MQSLLRAGRANARPAFSYHHIYPISKTPKYVDKSPPPHTDPVWGVDNSLSLFARLCAETKKFITMKKILLIAGAILSLIIAVFIMVKIFPLEEYLGGILITSLLIVIPIFSYIENEEWKKLWLALLVLLTTPISLILLLIAAIFLLLNDGLKSRQKRR